MKYQTLTDFLSKGRAALANGPIALIIVEDLCEVEKTIHHHLSAGFNSLVVFGPDELVLPSEIATDIVHVVFDTTFANSAEQIVNGVIKAAPGQWIYYCYNAEFLFHPFCETRSISELIRFHTEERRDAVLAYVIDLYAENLSQNPNAVSLESACLDKSGYYALERTDENNRGRPKERQLDFYGGLRWRFEEHIPDTRRRIDRIPLFKAKPGLKLLPDHRFNDEEYNTHSCKWHHNITLAIASFRTAKALKTNAASTYEIDTFKWHNTVQFQWNSQQLLDLGLMETGQWF